MAISASLAKFMKINATLFVVNQKPGELFIGKEWKVVTTEECAFGERQIFKEMISFFQKKHSSLSSRLTEKNITTFLDNLKMFSQNCSYKKAGKKTDHVCKLFRHGPRWHDHIKMMLDQRNLNKTHKSQLADYLGYLEFERRVLPQFYNAIAFERHFSEKAQEAILNGTTFVPQISAQSARWLIQVPFLNFTGSSKDSVKYLNDPVKSKPYILAMHQKRGESEEMDKAIEGALHCTHLLQMLTISSCFHRQLHSLAESLRGVREWHPADEVRDWDLFPLLKGAVDCYSDFLERNKKIENGIREDLLEIALNPKSAAKHVGAQWHNANDSLERVLAFLHQYEEKWDNRTSLYRRIYERLADGKKTLPVLNRLFPEKKLMIKPSEFAACPRPIAPLPKTMVEELKEMPLQQAVVAACSVEELSAPAVGRLPILNWADHVEEWDREQAMDEQRKAIAEVKPPVEPAVATASAQPTIQPVAPLRRWADVVRGKGI